MKKTIHIVFVFIMTLAFVACNKEQMSDQRIYAPNGLLVSPSMDDLSETIAEAIQLPKEDFKIETISFKEIDEGFIAAIDLFIKSDGGSMEVYYFSNLLNDRLTSDGSVEEVEIATTRGRPHLSTGTVAFCSCGEGSSTSSRLCKLKTTNLPNGGVARTCEVQGCLSGCVLHQ